VDRRADANAAPNAARAEVGLEELGFEQTLQAPEPTPTPERCLAERWVLGEVLGRGASGVVHRASDRLGGPDVAVKLLAPMGDQALERIRRESAALRMLTIPGVVRLLDDGQEDGEIYLVMELVEGAPFPGRRGPVPWAALAEPTLALLEALAQVHDAGIVHRDLKPANVLVTAGRRARILDFGLARGEALGETMTRTGVVVGTPRYLAPEQVVGAGVDARADLYAVGAMLFEALAGRPPQDAPSVQALLHLKLSEDAPSLAGSDVAAPPAVVHLVDRLLSREPAERPSSASEVLGALSRMGAGERRDGLPRLGGSAAVDALVEAARAGRSLDLCGAAGTGRSRALRDAVERLRPWCDAVLWLPAGEHPFASLAPLLGDGGLDGADATAVLARADAAVLAALRAGQVLVADDAERLDRWSAACLSRCRGAGAVLRALCGPTDAAVTLEPLTEAELRPLFAGPDRLLHRREDGARVLWARTRGLQRAVAAEVDDWLGAGVAEWREEELVVSQSALSRVRHQPLRPLALGDLDQAGALGASLGDLLAWVALSAPHATPALLRQVTGLPDWQVAVAVAELVELGAVACEADGRLLHRVSAARLQRWTLDQRRDAHARLVEALPLGAERRFEHVAVAGSAAQVAEEVAARGRWLVDEGRLEEAIGLAQRGLVALRRLGRASDEGPALELLVLAAISTQTAGPLDAAAWELRRSGLPGPELRAMLALVEAWQAALQGDAARALASVAGALPGGDEGLEAWRHALRVRLAVDGDLTQAEQLITELRPWAEAGSDEARGRHASWEGLLRYKQSRFHDAAALYRRATALRRGTAARIASLTNTATALLDAFDLSEARDVARELLAAADVARASYYETYAEWALRAIAYREGGPAAPDLELCRAAERVGEPGLTGLVHFTEAAVAWRGGDVTTARELLDRAHPAWAAPAWSWHRLLGRALAIELAGAVERADADALYAEALTCPFPRGRLQVIGSLLRHCTATKPETWHIEARRLAAEHVPQAHWATRLDLLSTCEALEVGRT
jgi:hypothetical protein